MRTPWSESEWRRVAVYGLGVSGLAAARFLHSQKVAVVGVDRRAEVELEDEGGLIESWVLGRDDPGLPTGVDAVVLSPGIPGDRRLVQEAKAAGLPVISEVELAFPFLAGPVVAITGSNGKSTSAAMTARILQRAGLDVELCGNIGEPLCSKIGGPPGRTFVVELSSFQLQDVALFKADGAALLNLSPDHLDRHHDFADYVAAKSRIFERQTPDSTAVLNADDTRTSEIGDRLSDPRRRFFSRRSKVSDGCFMVGADVLETSPGCQSQSLFSASDLQVEGVHNLENAMAAALLARSRGVSAEAIRNGLADFPGLPHRLQKVRRRLGVEWYDDSKGTNPGATEKSLLGFPDRSVHLILGGQSKGADPAALSDVIKRKVKHVYFIGEAAGELEAALGRWADSDNVGTLEVAIELAARRAEAGEIVLLSPACASFDQFESFEDRGRCFQSLVNALNGEPRGEEARV